MLFSSRLLPMEKGRSCPKTQGGVGSGSEDFLLGRVKLMPKRGSLSSWISYLTFCLASVRLAVCEQAGCEGCVIEAHINCSCSKERKIPVKDLAYIKGQKEKVGSKGPHQMGDP